MRLNANCIGEQLFLRGEVGLEETFYHLLEVVFERAG